MRKVKKEYKKTIIIDTPDRISSIKGWFIRFDKQAFLYI